MPKRSVKERIYRDGKEVGVAYHSAAESRAIEQQAEAKKAAATTKTHKQAASVERATRTVASGHKTVSRGTELGASVGAIGGPVGGAVGAVGGAAAGAGVAGAKKINEAGVNAATAPVQAVTSHTHSGILAWGSLLLILATWNDFWIPTWNAMKDKNVKWNVTDKAKRMELGGVAFVILMAFLANSSDDMEKVMTWLLIAFWIVFIIMNGTPTLKAVFTWFGQGGTTPPPQNPSKNTPPAPDPCAGLTGNALKLCQKNIA